MDSSRATSSGDFAKLLAKHNALKAELPEMVRRATAVSESCAALIAAGGQLCKMADYDALKAEHDAVNKKIKELFFSAEEMSCFSKSFATGELP
jgi:uncharacterized protein YdcH (DUF465 family)